MGQIVIHLKAKQLSFKGWWRTGRPAEYRFLAQHTPDMHLSQETLLHLSPPYVPPAQKLDWILQCPTKQQACQISKESSFFHFNLSLGSCPAAWEDLSALSSTQCLLNESIKQSSASQCLCKIYHCFCGVHRGIANCDWKTAQQILVQNLHVTCWSLTPV